MDDDNKPVTNPDGTEAEAPEATEEEEEKEEGEEAVDETVA